MRASLPAIIMMLLSSCGLAQSIAYTVQVVAVSDQAQAFSLIRDLGIDGFPAYATRASTEQGDVVRVRVGGFANRAAALLYAETMPDFPSPGSRPLPALADNIPTGIMPFEPRLLLDTESDEFKLLDWADTLAVQFPASDVQPSDYLLIRDGNSVEFSAWQSWPDGTGLVFRFRDLSLWPADWTELDEDILELEQDTQLEFLAARLEIDADLLADAVRDRDGIPSLVVLERFNPWLSLEIGQLLAVTVPVTGDSGPWEGELLGEAEAEPAALETVLLEVHEGLQVTSLETEEWTLEADGGFMLQSAPGVNRSWRAAVGAPLWTDGTFVLARHEGRMLLYDFLNRQ